MNTYRHQKHIVPGECYECGDRTKTECGCGYPKCAICGKLVSDCCGLETRGYFCKMCDCGSYRMMCTGLRIAFGCQAQVGKDTAVEYLIRAHGGIKLSFAEPLYDIMKYAQGRCGIEVKKDREFLQWVGTEWARKRDPDLWVKCFVTRLKKIPTGTNVFVSDLRFPNEFKALKEAGFTCVRILRDPRLRHHLHPEAQKHKSENALLDASWDKIIKNNAGKDTFYEKLNCLISKQG